MHPSIRYRLDRLSQRLLVLLLAISFAACDDPVIIPPDDPDFEGTGVFTYTDYLPLSSKPIRVFYHIPAHTDNATPMLFLFHGGDRNAAAYRNAMISAADQYGFMVFAPEFNSTYYPGGDAYNLGNVFVDGDNPSNPTLINEAEWTFSIIEPLFAFVKDAMESSVPTYDILGHSAGAQFAHRLMIMKPANSFGTVVASAAGWYTVPDQAIDFPYGIGKSPAAVFGVTEFFSRDLVIMIGEADNDPDAPGLRRNDIVDAQGDDRLERAQHFMQRGEQLANEAGISFSWRYESLPGVGHDFGPVTAAAAELLYR